MGAQWLHLVDPFVFAYGYDLLLLVKFIDETALSAPGKGNKLTMLILFSAVTKQFRYWYAFCCDDRLFTNFPVWTEFTGAMLPCCC
jgi:hypothetical protein